MTTQFSLIETVIPLFKSWTNTVDINMSRLRILGLHVQRKEPQQFTYVSVCTFSSIFVLRLSISKRNVYSNRAKCFWKRTKQWPNITLSSACPLTFLIQTHLIFIVPFPVRETFKYNDLGVADGWTQEELNIMVQWVPHHIPIQTHGCVSICRAPYRHWRI